MSQWVLPETQDGSARQETVVRTGPSGLLLGHGRTSPITIRLFRPNPTRLLLAVPDYVTWLLAFRCISLGAHLSIVANERRRWQGLANAVVQCGGTVDFLDPDDALPSQGRPYRPSLVIDDAAGFDGTTIPLGPWQAVMMTADASHSGAIHLLRSCDMALASPCDSKTTDNLRRAYALNPRQLRLTNNLEANEVALCMPRRVNRVSIPPTPTEYSLLFGPR
jgi:hypothetical protein